MGTGCRLRISSRIKVLVWIRRERVCYCFQKEDIKSVITMKDMIEADKQAFKMVVDGTVDTPLRTVINGKYDGAFLFMPAYAPELDAAAMKVINIFPHNIDNNLMTSPAQTMLIDGKTGYVDRDAGWNLCDTASYGASSGAAFDLLGKRNVKRCK